MPSLANRLWMYRHEREGDRRLPEVGAVAQLRLSLLNVQLVLKFRGE